MCAMLGKFRVECLVVLAGTVVAGCSSLPAGSMTGGAVGDPSAAGVGGGVAGTQDPSGAAGTAVTPTGAAGTEAAAGAGGMPPEGGTAGTMAPPAGSGAGADGSAEAGAGAAGSAAGAGAGGEGGAPPQPVTCPATSTLRAGDTTMRTPVGGRNGGMRTYIVHVPASYDGSKPVPLMINFHPLIFGTGSGQRTGSGWAQVGDREGIITAFPDGYDAAWDIGNCCTRGDVDDMAFALAIVEEISKAACIDPNRVYASGYSMGGGMSHLLGCKAANVFAAIAPSAFDLTEENHIPCEPARPLTVVMHRGMSDSVVPYRGGATRPPNGTPVTVTMLGAVGTFDEWSRINGCTDQPMTSGSCRRRSQCNNGVEVVLCENGGHTQGPAAEIWETLKKHGLSGPL
jgi:polyhydroxybutyrate depolymerase